MSDTSQPFHTDKSHNTPRTEAELIYLNDGHRADIFVNATFARQLERELAAMTADRDMWLKDDAKQNDALGRVIAERDALKSATRPTLTEDDVAALRELLYEHNRLRIAFQHKLQDSVIPLKHEVEQRAKAALEKFCQYVGEK